MKALLLVALLAQAAPFAGQGGQMPDPKQMSGMPLPVPDVPAGTVTARVIRGALTNPLKDQTVELTGSGATKTAKTDESGRATFTGLAPGMRVKTAVVVNGERIESQEFDVPAAGGIRLMLVATDPELEKKAAEDRKLAEGPAVTGAVVLGGESRFVIEAGDDALNVFNLLQIVNSAKRPVQTERPLVFDLPKGAVGVGMMEGSTPSAIAVGNRVTVNGPFAPGNTTLQFAYSIPLGAESVTLKQNMPAQLTQLSVIAQKVGATQLSSPQVKERREMNSDGQNFIVAQGGAIKAGDSLTLTLSGLPHRSVWPRNIALLLSTIILGAGVWGVATRGENPRQLARRERLQSRREKLFADLAALEAQRRAASVSGTAYASRRADLVASLEGVYAELE